MPLYRGRSSPGSRSRSGCLHGRAGGRGAAPRRRRVASDRDPRGVGRVHGAAPRLAGPRAVRGERVRPDRPSADTQPRLLPKVAAGLRVGLEPARRPPGRRPATNRLVWSAERTGGLLRRGPSRDVTALALDSVTGAHDPVARGFAGRRRSRTPPLRRSSVFVTWRDSSDGRASRGDTVSIEAVYREISSFVDAGHRPGPASQSGDRDHVSGSSSSPAP